MADPTKGASSTATSAQAEQAFSIEDITEEASYLNMVIYGPYGSGKTTLFATAADVKEMRDVLYIDIESGAMTIQDSDRISVEGKKHISRIRVKSFRQMSKVHEFLKSHCRLRDKEDEDSIKKLIALEAKFRGVDPKAIKVPKRYHTVGIDSLSELDQLTMYELLGLPSPEDIKLDEVLNDNDMEVADWPIFRKNNQMLQLIIRAYRDLPVNFIAVCHAGYIQDETKKMHYAPGLTGKLSAQVQGFVDIVGYLKVGQATEKGEAPRRLYVQPTGNFDAKNRKAAFKESYFDNPTMQDIWEASE